MLAAASFESTGCYRRHLNFAAGGRAEAVPGYTGAVRPWTGVRVTALTEPPIPDGVVVIENGRISAVGQRDTMRVPDGIATLECSGSTSTAGFWNSHSGPTLRTVRRANR